MNIFVIDPDPILSAQNLCDKHITQMFNEACQMLGYTKDGQKKKSSWMNHPCSVWAHDSDANYTWLIAHAQAIANEHYVRHGTHRKEEMLEHLANCIEENDIASLLIAYRGLTDKVQIADWESNKPKQFVLPKSVAACCPDMQIAMAGENALVSPELAVASYREYYIAKKAKFAVWRKTPIPAWWPGIGQTFGRLCCPITLKKPTGSHDGVYIRNEAGATMPVANIPDVNIVKKTRKKRVAGGSKRKALPTISQLQLSAADEMFIMEIRDHIKKELNGKHVPTTKRVAGWLRDGNPQKSADGHIAYWLARG